MAFENDPEGHRMAQCYAGGDYDKPEIVQHELLREYGAEWTFDDFKQLIAELSGEIPTEYRHTAKVEMHDPGYDGSTSLQIYYFAPESAETVADRVRQCEEYVAGRRSEERRTYEALKAKFG
jgi:hypothetical protein